jgi:hypothetical protein
VAEIGFKAMAGDDTPGTSAWSAVRDALPADGTRAVHDLAVSAECSRVSQNRSRARQLGLFCQAGAVTFMLGRCPGVVPAFKLGDHSYVGYLTVDSVDAYPRSHFSRPI